MPSVLVVDDDAPSRQLIAALAASLHCAVYEAESGAAGLEAVQRLQPDLIVLDLSLSDMHGADFLKTLRREMKNTTAVALYTATALDDATAAFMKLYDVRCSVPKPGEAADVIRALSLALSSS